MKVIKDKWFYYQLCSGIIIIIIIIIIALLTVYLYHMITKTWLRNIDSLFSPVLFQGQFFSFFTYQSNFLLGIWFIASACTFHKRQYWWKNQYNRIAITSYITVTCITFMAFLLPAMLMAEKFYFSKILVGLFFHLVTPILMIVYLFMHREKITLTNKQYFGKVFPIYLIYPFLYTFFLCFRFGLYINDPVLNKIPYDIIFPYALLTKRDFPFIFANVFELVFSIIAILIISYLLFILVNIIYFFTIKVVSNRKGNL